jgi:hypothetical protein
LPTEQHTPTPSDDEVVAQFHEQLREAMKRDGALKTEPKQAVRPPPDVEKLYFKGSLSEQVEFQLSVLT